ncbi:MAG: hypothetical protein IT442_06510, partial [Phycisphaeraceae bacterium]|nr:hypothetical protein [Phycisphaeraceae bacterium]
MRPTSSYLRPARRPWQLAAIALSILSTLTLTAGQRDHDGSVRIVRSANAGLIQSPDVSDSLPSSAQLLRALRPQRSNYYQIFTNLPPDEAQIYATHMDQVFAAYERRFNAFEERSTGPMPLYLFRSRQDYQAFLKLQQIDGENSGGMFFVCPTGRGLATFVGDQPRAKVFATLQHEGFHQFADKYIGPNLPIWINEG